MANYQPSEDEIGIFMACIPSVERREIIARIKGNNNSVEYAINEFFENPGDPENKYRWVDGHFSDGRDGEYNPSSAPSFNIHAPDETGPYEVREPQTRPTTPSRITNNRSPMTNVIDLTMEHGIANPKMSVTHDDDVELQKAIKESRISAGLPPQESGVTGTDRVHFGPATRNQYEDEKWAMTVAGKSTAQEILLDPEPAARKRDLNVPAFLKPSVESHRLGALFTIYHEIPLLREIFMNRLDVQQSYGFDSEWWTGKAIEVPYLSGSEPDEGQELLYEIQRLMAFLDKTDRSYGSADTLANLRAVKKAQRLNFQRSGGNAELETVVWLAWKKVFETRETGQVSKMFSVGVESERSNEITEFAILDLPLPGKTSDLETFYDIADEALWGSGPYIDTDILSSAYLEHIGDVITFRLKEDEPSNSIDIPAVWYPDRYLQSGRQAALEMRIQKTEINEAIRKIDNLQDGLTEYIVRGKIVKVQDLLKAALRHDLDEVKEEDETDPSESFLSEGAAMSKASSEKAAKLSFELGKIVASIDEKLIALNSEKEKARDSLRELSKLYTEPSSDPNEPPTHKYTLRGVSTTKSTVYIRRKAEIDLIDMGLENDESPPNDDQWWKIEYASSGSNPVTVEKKTEEEVLEAAKTESKNIMLVYASEKAMQFESKPLPHSLETFVRNDNQCFKAELTEDDSQSQVTSPGKRKFDAQSNDSGDLTRRNGGTSPKGYENSIQVMERELRGSDGSSELDGAQAASYSLADQLDESRTVTPDEGEHEVIHGIDPAMLSNDNTPFSGQEMKERSGMPLLSSRAGGERATTIDSMDLDQVMEDEHMTEESAAVKSVELA